MVCSVVPKAFSTQENQITCFIRELHGGDAKIVGWWLVTICCRRDVIGLAPVIVPRAMQVWRGNEQAWPGSNVQVFGRAGKKQREARSGM